MPVRQGATTRALMALTVEATKHARERATRDAEMGLTEIMQQFQVVFSGAAGGIWAFAETVLHFDYPFYYAPGQRDPDFDRPHFWFGAEVTPPIAVSAVVTEWLLDPDNDAVVGARVAIGVAGETPFYSGKTHLTFQGFSALGEDETDFADID